MKYLPLIERLGQLPAPVLHENKGIRTTAIMALATSLLVPVPTQILSAVEQQRYFFDNVQEVRNKLFELNEFVPFNIDRAIEIAGKIWRKRYEMLVQPTAATLINITSPAETYLPEMYREKGPYLGVSPDEVDFAVQCLRA